MNWIEETFRKMGVKVDSNPKCDKCGKGFRDHANEDLKNCSKN